MRLFGVDVSSHQGMINFDMLAAARKPEKVNYIAIRMGISWGYIDKWFSRNWSEAKRIYLYRAAYHTLYPGESSIRQMDNFYRILGDDIGELPQVVAAELVHGQTKRTITNRIVECANIILNRSGKLPLLYSRTEWLNANTYPQELAFLKLWVAQYLNIRPGETYAREHVGPPDLPTGFTNWAFHQTGDKTTPVGFGVQSETLDYDRFNGSLNDMEELFNLKSKQVELTLADRVTKLETVARSKGWGI